MESEDETPDESLLDRRQVILDAETFDALQRRVDAPGAARAGTVDLFRRKPPDELVARTRQVGLGHVD